MTEIPDPEVVTADLQQQKEALGLLTIEIDPFAAFCVVGQIQLASRHPENMGQSLETACRFAAALAGLLPETAQEVIALGWDPAYDEGPDDA